jgi:maltose O-acetyltransferase
MKRYFRLTKLRRLLRTFATLILEFGVDFEAKLQDPPTAYTYRPVLIAYLNFMGVKRSGLVIAGTNFRILKPGNMTLGDYVSFGSNCSITNHGTILIGNDVMIAPGLCINTGTHDPVTLESRSTVVTIGDHVWIGSSVNIIEDCVIPSGCVIGASAVVRGRFECNSLIVGNPGRCVKKLNRNATTRCWMPMN